MTVEFSFASRMPIWKVGYQEESESVRFSLGGHVGILEGLVLTKFFDLVNQVGFNQEESPWSYEMQLNKGLVDRTVAVVSGDDSISFSINRENDTLTKIKAIQDLVYRILQPSFALALGIRTSYPTLDWVCVAKIQEAWESRGKEAAKRLGPHRVKYSQALLPRSVTWLKDGYIIHLKKKDGAFIAQGGFAKTYSAIKVKLFDNNISISIKAETRKNLRYLPVDSDAARILPVDLSIEPPPHLTVDYNSTMQIGASRFSVRKKAIIKELFWGDIRDALNAKKFSVEQEFKWFIWVARGLYLLHSNALVHGDIKPENFLVARDGNRAVLCDFDFLTIEGQRCKYSCFGSEDYHSPEVSKMVQGFIKRLQLGEKITEDSHIVMTASHDIYSFAVGLKQYFNFRNNSVIHNSRLASLITNCLNEDPKLRPSAGKVLEELRGVYKESFKKKFKFEDGFDL